MIRRRPGPNPGRPLFPYTTLFRSAHHAQTELIQAEIRGEKAPLNLLMVHAQDHLMTALVVIDLAQEFIDLYKKVG